MKKLLAVLALALTMSACTNDEATISTLHKHGFSDVQTTGYEFWECGEDDTFHTGFVATNPAGQRVRGTVCCGWLDKGCTVRF